MANLHSLVTIVAIMATVTTKYGRVGVNPQMIKEVGVVSYGIREARDKFTQLRRRALRGEEIIVGKDAADDGTESVSIVPTWLIDEYVSRRLDWSVEWLSAPGDPVSNWESVQNGVREIPNAGTCDVYTVEHKATGITGVGDTAEDAIESLIDGLRAYADEFYSEPEFYLSVRSGRRDHLPFLRTIKRYETDRAVLRRLFTDPPSVTSA